jgi:hypothetical protein
MSLSYSGILLLNSACFSALLAVYFVLMDVHDG